MRVLDLFSGIGGFSLGLERAGMQTVAFCEIDPYCRKVLAKHWPGVPCYDDIRTLTASRLAADGIIAAPAADAECTRREGLLHGRKLDDVERSLRQDGAGQAIDVESCRIDVVCGGFPCQDISSAGKGAGIDGERSGLWREMARVIGEVRPRYVVVENVSALLVRGLGRVLGDLAALGYDAEWHCIPASYIGAPHRRDRIWIVAHPRCLDGNGRAGECGTADRGSPQRGQAGDNAERCNALADVADASGPVLEGQWLASRIQAERDSVGGTGWWESESDVGRVAHGVRNRVDRLRALGNAVVPQIPELIGRAIMHNEGGSDGEQR